MAIFLDQLYSQTKDTYQLELLTKPSTLEHIVSWVYITEDYASPEFLSGNELILTIGISVAEKTNWLKGFIQALIDCHASGLIINTGKYILKQDITEEIIALCNDNHFPLFQMPWKTRIIHITKDYYHRIFEDTRSYENTRSIFQKTLQGYKLSPLETSLLRENGFTYPYYCVCTCRSHNDHVSAETSFKEIYPMLLHKMQTSITEEDLVANYHISLFEGQIILLFNLKNNTSVSACTASILSQINDAFANLDLCAGLSDTTSDIHDLKNIFIRSKAALTMAENQNRHFISYEDLGFMKILLEVKNRDILEHYVSENLDPILTYDQIHHASLLETLSLYFKYQGSLQKIAAAMFCHRNTVNYRTGLIKKLLSDSLEDGEHNFQLSAAIFIYHYLNSEKKID